MFFFDNETRAREDAERLGRQTESRARELVNSSAARGMASPVALATGANRSVESQRAALAPVQAEMLARGRQADRQAVLNLIGGGLSLAGTIGGMAMGGPAGGSVGGQAGSALGSLVGAKPAAAPAQSPSGPAQGGNPLQTTLGMVDQAIAAPAPQPQSAQRPVVPFDRPADSLGQDALLQLQQVGQANRPGPAQSPPAQTPTGAMSPYLAQLVQQLQAGMPGAISPVTSNPPSSFILSDEESKTAIRDAAAAIDQFLGSMSPQSFEYRNPMDAGASQGRRTGVMAQDLERSEVGRQMVQEGPGGQRVIDSNAALSGLLAAQARLHDRLAALEEGRGGAPASQSRVRELSPEQFAAEDPPEAALLAAEERRAPIQAARQVPMDAVSGPAQPLPPARPAPPAPVAPMPPRPSVLDRFLESVEGAGSSVMGLFR